MDLPWRRVMNIAYTLYTEDWTPEARAEFDLLLATREEKSQAFAEEQDRDARRTAQFLGGNVDAMIEQAWKARQSALAQQQAKLDQPPLVDWSKIEPEPTMAEA